MASYPVSDEQIAAYDRDGVTLLPGLVEPKWIERNLKDDKTGQPNAYFMRLRLWEHDPDLREFCFDSRIAEAGAKLLRTNRVNLLYDQLFVKEPGSAARTPWHNDQPYWPVRGIQVLTLWIAFDVVTAENGALEFIRGSHKLNKWYRPWDVDDSGNMINRFQGDEDEKFEDLPNYEANRAGYDIATWDMQPGDAVAFHALTVHGAPGNKRSDARRRGYAIRMTGADVRYFAGKVWNVYITNPDLKTGDRLDSPQYPLLFDASQTR